MPPSKSTTRGQIHFDLLQVAIPDSRHHLDLTAFIPDFVDSARATAQLTQLPIYRSSSTIFVAPDNSLEAVRARALYDGKRVLTSTYGLRRGFHLLDPARIAASEYRYAAMLDGMERVVGGEAIGLAEVAARGMEVPLMVTGTAAVEGGSGVRIGKGHGYFDLEWAMLFALGVVDGRTKVATVVHDCQVIDGGWDAGVVPEVFDTACDVIVTPTRVIEVAAAAKPTCGIVWELLQPGMLEDIPPLQELKAMNLEGCRQAQPSINT